MTHTDLQLWRARRGWPQREAAAALGITITSYQRLERGRCWRTDRPLVIDRRTALACAAIEAGVEPMGSPVRNTSGR